MVDVSSARRMRRPGALSASSPLLSPTPANYGPWGNTPVPATFQPFPQTDYKTGGVISAGTPAPAPVPAPTKPVAINPYMAPPPGSLSSQVPVGAIAGTQSIGGWLGDAQDSVVQSPVKGSGNGFLDLLGRFSDAGKSFAGNGTAPVYDQATGQYLGYDPSSPDKEEGVSKLINLFKFFSM